jgi:hypothetical protein
MCRSLTWPPSFPSLGTGEAAHGLAAPQLPSFLFSDPQQLIWVCADSFRDNNIFRDVEPALSALVLRDERLRPPQLHCQLRLRDPGFLPSVDQAGQGPVVEVGEEVPRTAPGGFWRGRRYRTCSCSTFSCFGAKFYFSRGGSSGPESSSPRRSQCAWP